MGDIAGEYEMASDEDRIEYHDKALEKAKEDVSFASRGLRSYHYTN